MGKIYKVDTGRRYRYFDTIEDATAFCAEVFAKTKIVLSIVAVTRR